jgi:Flp pilus assembly protein TadB
VTAVLAATLPGVALLLAPALLLFVVLLLGFTPGEQLLERMRARRFTRQADRAPRALGIRHVVVVRRMPSLATSALAMRPPPAIPARRR